MTKEKDTELEKKVHGAFLSDDEKEKIKLQVEKELEVEMKKKVADDYKATLKAAAKKKALFKDAPEGTNEEGLVPVFIDLPKVSECIRLDGVAYFPGRTYNVTPAVREVLNEIMYRGYGHEDEVTGRKDSNAGRAKRNSIVKN